MIPTRWRTLIDEQLEDAVHRLQEARKHLASGDGARAMQGAYQATVTAASIRVWMQKHPWDTTLPADEMQRRAVAEFPTGFASMATLDLPSLLRGFWSPDAALPYVSETEAFVQATRDQFDSWVAAA